MNKSFVNIFAWASLSLCICQNINAEEPEVVINNDEQAATVSDDASLADKSMTSEYATGASSSLAGALQAVSPNAPDWTKDVASRITVSGYAQGGYAWANKDGVNTNSFELKRAILMASARITPRWYFYFMHDLSSVVQEYYTNFRVTNNNALTVRLGQFKNGYSYENATSPTARELIDVYSEGVTYLAGCGSDPLYGLQYGRDLGLSFYGETKNKFFSYEVDVLNGQGVNQKDRNNKKDIIAKLAVSPFDGFSIVATGQLGYGNALKGGTIFNPTMVEGEDYKRNRYSAGIVYSSNAFNVHGEYLEGKDGDAVSRGAYVTGSAKLFTFKNKSSLDFIASYDFFNFNVAQQRDMHKVVAGFQYWFFKKCRFQVQYIYKSAITDYSSMFEKKGNHGIMCQMQVRFN